MKKLAKLLPLLLVVALCALMFVGCGVPDDYNTARSNLEENGYKVYVQDVEDMQLFLALVGIDLDDCSGKILTASDDDDNAIVIFYLDSEEAANDVYDDLSNLNTALEEYFDVDSGATTRACQGKVVYWAVGDAESDCK